MGTGAGFGAGRRGQPCLPGRCSLKPPGISSKAAGGKSRWCRSRGRGCRTARCLHKTAGGQRARGRCTMGNWLVNHWFSAAVLVSAWGWGPRLPGGAGLPGGTAWRAQGGNGGCPGAGLQGATSIATARGGMGFRRQEENTARRRRGGGSHCKAWKRCCFAHEPLSLRGSGRPRREPAPQGRRAVPRSGIAAVTGLARPAPHRLLGTVRGAPNAWGNGALWKVALFSFFF